MDSGMVRKIEKSKRYAEERHRISFNEFRVTLEGNHALHHISFRDGEWSCDCSFFSRRGVCSHTMALERVLGEMLTQKGEKA